MLAHIFTFVLNVDQFVEYFSADDLKNGPVTHTDLVLLKKRKSPKDAVNISQWHCISSCCIEYEILVQKILCFPLYP